MDIPTCSFATFTVTLASANRPDTKSAPITFDIHEQPFCCIRDQAPCQRVCPVDRGGTSESKLKSTLLEGGRWSSSTRPDGQYTALAEKSERMAKTGHPDLSRKADRS